MHTHTHTQSLPPRPPVCVCVSCPPPPVCVSATPLPLTPPPPPPRPLSLHARRRTLLRCRGKLSRGNWVGVRGRGGGRKSVEARGRGVEGHKGAPPRGRDSITTWPEMHTAVSPQALLQHSCHTYAALDIKRHSHKHCNTGPRTPEMELVTPCC